MEGAVLGSEAKKRGRKRKNMEVQNVTVDNDGKKRVMDMRPKPFVGRYVKKKFEGSRVFLGKIVSYDTGLYRVDYEDGDCEDLDSGELRQLLIDENALDKKWLVKKRKLDELLLKKSKEKSLKSEKEKSPVSDEDNKNDAEDEDDGDLSDDLEEKVVIEVAPLVPAPILPPSSGNIGIEEDYVSHLLSVYCFLRSFSIQLFLSPFGLDEFVGSLNSSGQNTLLDSVHVALMRVLMRHLEKLSSDGSDLATKCLRWLDWNLLDTLTWPVYLVHYLMVIGQMYGPEWKILYKHIMEKDYYSMSASKKLVILQILCDSVLDSDELRTEVDTREESEVGLDSDVVKNPLSGPPRRVHPRNSKTAALEYNKDEQNDVENEDGNGDECRLCGMDGVLLCCDGCPSSYHSRCIGVSKMFVPDGDWFCPECIINKSGPTIMKSTALKGAEIFGVDPYNQVFLATCDFLLVVKGDINLASCIRYYNHNQIAQLLEALNSDVNHIPMYTDICKGIKQYFDVPKVDAEVASSNTYKRSVDIFLYNGSSFKAQGYINNYAHGDFAATAAANLATLTVDATQILSSQDKRKVMYANVMLQTKAFSSAAMRFFWPHIDKKLVEVPRERCSWCYSCKAPVSSRRGCLLNAAASQAIKGALKVLAGLRGSKNVEPSVTGIATYVMLMEESLTGLTLGPFLNTSFRKQWRRQLEHASTISAIKPLLIQFEENIRGIGLSIEWGKLVDVFSSDVNVTQSEKRRPGRKPKKGAVIEVTPRGDDDVSKDVADITWWRGGKFAKLVFQKETLPTTLLKKAARQGGKKKIPNIYYTENVGDTAKRTRQHVWRAAVETSQNVSQLALQVRYLDSYVKWGEIVRPEQSNVQEGKGGTESESSVFRNAYVSDKKILDNEVRYGVAFGTQKHLPSKVLKNILEKEEKEDGSELLWFLETRLPLFLIKEYEENTGIVSSNVKNSSMMSKLQRKQLRDSRKDIFLYLTRKRDNKEKIYCASCQRSVLLGMVVKCSECQGLCHEGCTMSLTVNGGEEVEYVMTCKQCYSAKSVVKNVVSPTSPLPMVESSGTPVSYSYSYSSSSSVPVTTQQQQQSKSSKCHWGLIWKRKKCKDNGLEFRMNNLVLKGNPDMDWLTPTCVLCNQGYNTELMYICCEECKNWVHADAVGLKEERIFELVGFKCCKCRRIKSPVCPYGKAEIKKTSEIKKLKVRGPKLPGPDIKKVDNEEEEEIKYVAADDPLLVGYQQLSVESDWNNNNTTTPVSVGGGPQKLQVRRNNVKPDEEVGGGTSNSLNNDGLEWDVGVSVGEDDESLMFNYEYLNYEDMEFEPQTYFSVNELLDDDSGVGDMMMDDIKEEGTGEGEMMIKNEEEGIGGGEVVVACKTCLQKDPCPDLICESCGAWMHSHCSPWDAAPNGWRCANCREWQ